MDCPSCVNTIEAAVSKFAGVSDAKLSFSNETLELVLDASVTNPQQVEQKVRALGYRVDQVSADPDTGAAPPRAPDIAPLARWWRMPKTRLVLASGALLSVAVVAEVVAHPETHWIFALAALAGLVPFADRAVRAAVAGSPFTIEMLVSIAVVGAVVIDAAPEGAVVVFLFAVGEWLESVASRKARSSIQSLADLVPKTAYLVDDGRTREVPAAALRVGELVEVRPGDRVPADGTIAEGRTSCDEAPVTGESVPREKGVGDPVYAGTISLDGMIRIRVDRDPADNTIARIIQLVEEAEMNKAPTARFIDRFSLYYTPGVIAVALLVAVVPPLAFAAPWADWIYKGLALLLIGCPCALVLSTPAAITSGISAGARRGLLLKGGATLENVGKVATMAFDKTGTLTRGEPRVTDVVTLAADDTRLLALAAGVESSSGHPLARAIVSRAEEAGIALPSATDARAYPGKGASAAIEGMTIIVASPGYAESLGAMTEDARRRAELLEDAGKTVVVVIEGQRIAGLLGLRDEPRADSAEALESLRRLGIRTIVLTGDNARTARAIGDTLAVEVQAELLPEDKIRVLDSLKTRGLLAMVGDGINDAPALAHADVGIAMGGGTEVALEAASAALLHDRVSDVVDLVRLSRATMRNIRQNITVALGLKAVFLVTTLLGVTTLWMAILADTGATVVVTANALRLLGFKMRPAT
jgi:Cd2+/Zn2+-exporting ATPase